MEKVLYLKTISFDTNGGSNVSEQKLLMGEKVKRPSDPGKVKALFDGWYTDNGTWTDEWDFSAVPSDSFTLYANWLPKTVVDIAVATQPKLIYTNGERLDLSRLVIQINYDAGAPDYIPFANFAGNDITASPPLEHGTVLTLFDDGKVITITMGGTYSCQTNLLTVGKTPVNSAALIVTAPVLGVAPDTTASCVTGSNVNPGTITWSPAPGSLFAANTVYTATIAIMPVIDCIFTNNLTATVNGQPATVTNNVGTAATVTFTFPATAAKTITGISIEAYPIKQIYTYGEPLDLSGLKIDVSYSDGSTDNNLTFSDFGSVGFTAVPAHGDIVSVWEHNGKPVKIFWPGSTSFITPIDPLTVNPKTLTISGVNATNREYNGTTTVALTGGALQSIVAGDTVGFILGSGTITNANAGDGKAVTTNITLSGTAAAIANYTLTQPALTVNIEQKMLTITSISHTKPYDGTTIMPSSEIGITFSGVLSGETVSATVNASYASEVPGTRDIVISDITLTGNDATNYRTTETSPIYYTMSTGGIIASTSSIQLNVEQITEGAPLPDDNITISRSGAGYLKMYYLQVVNPGLYDANSIRWEVDGVGAYAGQKVTETGAFFYLDADINNSTHVIYNTFGGHTIRLYVKIGGVEYMRNINFKIVE